MEVKHKIAFSKKVTSIAIIICLIAAYAWWNGVMSVQAYETSISSSSRTYSKGYFDVIINGPSGKEWINGEVNYSGSQMTQDKFNDAARTVTLNRKSGEASGVYKAKITTTSTKTKTNSSGNYTRIEFNIQYTQPAHEEFSSESADAVSQLGSTYQKTYSNFKSQSGHSTSSRVVTVKINMSIYACGLCTYKNGNNYQRVWNTAINLNLKKNNYILSFNGNGGSVSQASRVVACGAQVGTLPTASRTGYSLRGWAFGAADVNPNAWNTSYICSNTTFYALWSPNQYTIKYVLNGVEGSLANTTAIYAQNVTLRSNPYQLDGYRFLGWSTDSNATSANYTDGQTINWNHAGDMTLYAVWAKDNYKVKLNGNGSSMSEKIVRLKYGQKDRLPVNEFTRGGYKFMGWSKKEDVSEITYKDGEDVTNLAEAGDTVTLYAVWQKSDATFDMHNIIHDDKMFLGDIYIEGGNGTMYGSAHTDSKYARIDKENEYGYFTKRW